MRRYILHAIYLICCFCNNLNAQVPNGDFEKWTSIGNYKNPDNWTTNNTSIYAPVKEFNTPAHNGSSSVQLDSGAKMVINFTISEAPDSFIFDFKMGRANDTFNTVLKTYVGGVAYPAQVHSQIGAPTGVWLHFMQYLGTNYIDSVQLEVYGGKDTASHIYLDDIRLFRTPVGIAKLNNNKIDVFPNPMKTSSVIQASKIGKYTFYLFNAIGQLIQTLEGFNSLILQRGELQGGVYFYQLYDDRISVAHGRLLIE